MFRRSFMTMVATAGLTLALTGGYVRADDDAKVDNPEYKAWAKFKPDSATTYDMTVEFGGMSQSGTVNAKLASVADDKVSVKTSVTMNGNDAPAQTKDIDAKVEKAKALGDPTGNEDVTIGDKTYKCKVYEIKGAPPGTDERQAKMMAGATTKLWASDEVPGGIVKMTCDMKMGDKTMSMKMTLTSVDSK